MIRPHLFGSFQDCVGKCVWGFSASWVRKYFEGNQSAWSVYCMTAFQLQMFWKLGISVIVGMLDVGFRKLEVAVVFSLVMKEWGTSVWLVLAVAITVSAYFWEHSFLAIAHFHDDTNLLSSVKLKGSAAFSELNRSVLFEQCWKIKNIEGPLNNIWWTPQIESSKVLWIIFED